MTWRLDQKLIERGKLGLGFLLGVPRSGTTLLSALLSQHSDVYCPPEPWLLLGMAALGQVSDAHPACAPLVNKAVNDFLGSQKLDLLKLASLSIYESKLLSVEKQFFIDKTPRYYLTLDVVEAFIQDAKFLILFRNPLDVAASYLTTWNINLADIIKNKEDSPALLDYMLGFKYLADFKSKHNVYSVNYEHLVGNVHEEMEKIFSELGLSEALVSEIIDSNSLALKESSFGDKKIFKQKNVHANSVDSYKNIFSSEEIGVLIGALGRNLFRDLGYLETYESACLEHKLLASDGVDQVVFDLAEDYLFGWNHKCANPLGSNIYSDKNLLLTEQLSLKNGLAESEVRVAEMAKQITLINELLVKEQQKSESITEQLHYYKNRGLKEQMLDLKSYIIERCKKILRPRLGVLNQHPPLPINLQTRLYSNMGLDDLPKISLVTPSYQQGKFIERTIQSVLNQQYEKLEYVIQDGGSYDSTLDIIKKYDGVLARWRSEPDSGQSQAINLGFADTDGEIMGWLNSDDLLLTGALNEVAEYFLRHPEVDVVYGNRLLIDENDMQIGRWMLPKHDDDVLSWADYVPQETMFWRRGLWDKVGGIDESFRFAMDWDLIIRFRDANARFAHIPSFLGAFRIHEHQKTSAEISEVGMREMDRIRESIHGRLPSFLEIQRAIAPYLFKHIVVDIIFRVRTRFTRVFNLRSLS